MKHAARLAALLALPAAFLAGCEDGAPSQNVTKITIANPQSDRLKALSPLYQRIGLSGVIQDSGKRCRRVDRLGYQEEYRGLAMWVALCDDGRHWAVFIAPNANVQVRECIHNAALRLPLCRPLPPLPADPSAPPNSAPPAGAAEAGNSQ